MDVRKDAAPEIQDPRVHRIQEELQQEGDVAADPDYELLEERTLFPFEEDSDGFYFAKIIRKT